MSEKQIKRELAELLKKCMDDFLPKEYAGAQWEVVEKENLEGEEHLYLLFRPSADMVPGTEPMVNLDKIFDRSDILGEIAWMGKVIAELSIRSVQEDVVQELLASVLFENIAPYVSMRIVNRERQKDFLESVVHKDYGEFAVYYVVDYPAGKKLSKVKMTVQDVMMETWGITEEELYRTAVQNLEKKTVMLPYEILEQGKGTDGCPNLFRADRAEEISPLYYMSTEDKYFGAAVIACPSIMKKAAGLFPGGLYLVPYSNHEILLSPKGSMTVEELEQVLTETRTKEEWEEEFLSGNLYECDREGAVRKISGGKKKGE